MLVTPHLFYNLIMLLPRLYMPDFLSVCFNQLECRRQFKHVRMHESHVTGTNLGEVVRNNNDNAFFFVAIVILRLI